MLLRTRVTVFVFAAFLALAGVIAVGIHQHAALLDSRIARASAAGLSALWVEITATGLEALGRDARMIAADPELAAAVAAQDRDAIAAALGRLEAGASGRGAAEGGRRIDVTHAGGGLLHTSSQEVFPEPFLSAETLKAAAEGPDQVRGVTYDRTLGLAIAVALPVRGDGGAMAGAVTLAEDLGPALRRIAAGTGGEIVVVNQRGRAIAGTDLELWSRLALTGGELTAFNGDRVFSVASTPIDYLNGRDAARMVILTDRTEEWRAQQRPLQLTIAGGAFLVLAILLALFLYLRQSFQPLGTAVVVLDALSSGDTAVSMEGMAGPDEVGTIAHTVEVFRRRTLALERITRARAKQRGRMERLIFAQMNALARTLDDDERGRVLADLEEIRASVAAAPDAAPDAALDTADSSGMEVTALALSKLTGRIGDQQGRLVQLIAELREALKSKTALLALRAEIDIAANIQLSVLPKPLPPEPRFAVRGLMIPAKEIGGDFYDFFYLDRDRLALVVADVSGKGVAAAFFMAISRTYLRALTLLVSAPGEAIARLNDMLCEDNEEAMFVTLFYGVLDLNTMELTYVSAGHNPPAWRRGDGRVEFLPQTAGIALGVMDGMGFKERLNSR